MYRVRVHIMLSLHEKGTLHLYVLLIIHTELPIYLHTNIMYIYIYVAILKNMHISELIKEQA